MMCGGVETLTIILILSPPLPLAVALTLTMPQHNIDKEPYQRGAIAAVHLTLPSLRYPCHRCSAHNPAVDLPPPSHRPPLTIAAVHLPSLQYN